MTKLAQSAVDTGRLAALLRECYQSVITVPPPNALTFPGPTLLGGDKDDLRSIVQGLLATREFATLLGVSDVSQVDTLSLGFCLGAVLDTGGADDEALMTFLGLCYQALTAS